MCADSLCRRVFENESEMINTVRLIAKKLKMTWSMEYPGNLFRTLFRRNLCLYLILLYETNSYPLTISNVHQITFGDCYTDFLSEFLSWSQWPPYFYQPVQNRQYLEMKDETWHLIVTMVNGAQDLNYLVSRNRNTEI